MGREKDKRESERERRKRMKYGGDIKEEEEPSDIEKG